MSAKMWLGIVAGVLACGLGVYAGVSHRHALFSYFGKIPSLGSRFVSSSKTKSDLKQDPSKPSQKELIQKQQENIAKSIAEQQAISQEVQRASAQSLADTQRTLRTIEEINRLNRANQQIQQQQRNK